MAENHTIHPAAIPPGGQPAILVQLRNPSGGLDHDADELLVHGLLDMARHYGWKLLNLELSLGVIPAGVVPAGAIVRALPTDPLARRLLGMGMPVIRIGNLPHPDDHLLPAVLFDAEAASRMAAEHFHERRFKHLGFIGRDPWGDSQVLYEKFRIRAAELDCQCHLVQIKQSQGADPVARYQERAREVGAWLHEMPKPLGIFAYNDAMGAAICTWCEAAGLHVPEDVAILGRGNRRFDCESAPVTLSSIDINREEYGQCAARLLHSLMQGYSAPAAPLRIRPKGVVVRQSTDILAVHDPIVVRGLRFLWNHLSEPISVDDVAAAAAVSRRKLERAFHNSLGRSVNVELRRKRLELARELLSSTDLTIAEIAESTGIGTSAYLHRAFRSKHGITPREYRQQQES